MAKVARLLDQIIPERYLLDIDVDMKGFRFSGSEKVAFSLAKHCSGAGISRHGAGGIGRKVDRRG